MFWRMRQMTFRLPNTIAVRTSLLFTLLAAGVLIVMGLMIRSSVSHHFNELDSALLEGKLELIHHILLDKTGTLTVGRPVLKACSDPARLGKAAAIASHSRHPLAAALRRAAGLVMTLEGVREIPGQGLEWQGPDGIWRLGSTRFTGQSDTGAATMTRFAPRRRCPSSVPGSRNLPVHSSTRSTPRSPQGISAGCACSEKNRRRSPMRLLGLAPLGSRSR